MSLSIDSLLGTSNVGSVYNDYSANSLKNVSNSYNNRIATVASDEEDGAFENIFQSALDLVNETNDYANVAAQE